MTPLEQKLLFAVRAKTWRGEVGLCREFGKVDEDPEVVDALYSLVRSGHLEWFGAEGETGGGSPLRYRVPPPRPCMSIKTRGTCYAGGSYHLASVSCAGDASVLGEAR